MTFRYSSKLLCGILALLSLVLMASALSSTCSTPLSSGTAGPSDPFWMQNIKHQGLAAFNSNPSEYQVFRNVKDFGAEGDGVTDDTAAINAAMSSGNRCGEGTCESTTTAPAIVYFPQGNYVVSQPIVAWYYTQIIGDARNPPTLTAAANFTGIAVIDADPYIPGGNGAQWYINQNNFYRSVRNFVIDLTQMPATSSATGLHWQVSQATSLMNIVVNMSTDPSTAHQGIFMENGSGGFMGDLVFNGGKYGIWVGNQQFTVRNITVNNAQSAIFALWNWGWTFQGVTINNCQVGFDLTTGGLDQNDQTVGAEAIIDAVATDTSIFLRTSQPSDGQLAGSLVLNNIQLNNVPTAVGVASNGAVVLNGGTTTIEHWVQGNVYAGSDTSGTFVQGSLTPPTKAASLLDGSGRIFGKTHPQYANYAVDQFVSIRSLGATGDGSTDDTQAIINAFAQYAGCKIIFFDHGTYIVTSTITIPAGTQVVGEAWSVIMGSGSAFEDINNPQPVVRVGDTNSQGVAEITDIVFTTRGPAAGAIVVEWNVHDPAGQQGAAGMWDSHIRLAGALGTDMGGNSCSNATQTGSSCIAAFLALHLTSASSAYLEGTWVWLADHSLDPPNNELEAYSGRGIYSQSQGPVWMIGTSEHHVLYQYNLAGAQDHYMGLIQTETAYFQPDPAPPAPFTSLSDYNDPTYSSSQNMALAVTITNSQDILIFGAGLYSFFQHYNQACLNTNDCQTQIFNVDSASTVFVYSLSTIASEFQISVNEQGIANQSANTDGLQSTVTVWTSS